MSLRKQPVSLAPLTCALGAVILYCLLIGPILLSKGPSWFLYLGRLDRDPPTVGQVERILGHKVSVAALYGHDGREFWLLAQDPLLLSPQRDIALLDRPAYRAARIAYPLAAAPWGLLGSTALLIGLVMTNLIAVAVGTYFAAKLALHYRAPPLASVFFAVSPLVVVATLLDLSDALSLAALVASLYLFIRARFGWATLAAVVAVLAKQPALLAIVAVAIASSSVSTRRRLLYAGVPTVVLVAWTAYTLLRLGGSGASVVEFTLPFVGFFDAISIWSRPGRWIDAVVALALIPAAVLVIRQWWRKRTLLLSAALPFALVVPFLAEPVLTLSFNSLRAFGPAITLFGIGWFEARTSGSSEDQPAAAPTSDRRHPAGALSRDPGAR